MKILLLNKTGWLCTTVSGTTGAVSCSKEATLPQSKSNILSSSFPFCLEVSATILKIFLYYKIGEETLNENLMSQKYHTEVKQLNFKWLRLSLVPISSIAWLSQLFTQATHFCLPSELHCSCVVSLGQFHGGHRLNVLFFLLFFCEIDWFYFNAQ